MKVNNICELGRVFHALDTRVFSHLHPVDGLGFLGIATLFVVGYVDVGYGSGRAPMFSGIEYPFSRFLGCRQCRKTEPSRNDRRIRSDLLIS